jgi:hypothetical protein
MPPRASTPVVAHPSLRAMLDLTPRAPTRWSRQNTLTLVVGNCLASATTMEHLLHDLLPQV